MGLSNVELKLLVKIEYVSYWNLSAVEKLKIRVIWYKLTSNDRPYYRT